MPTSRKRTDKPSRAPHEQAAWVLTSVLSYPKPKAAAAIKALPAKAVSALAAIDLTKPNQAGEVQLIMDRAADAPDEPTDIV